MTLRILMVTSEWCYGTPSEYGGVLHGSSWRDENGLVEWLGKHDIPIKRPKPGLGAIADLDDDQAVLFKLRWL